MDLSLASPYMLKLKGKVINEIYHPQDAEEICNTILFDIFKCKPSGRCNVGTLIYLITQRRIIDMIRKRKNGIKLVSINGIGEIVLVANESKREATRNRLREFLKPILRKNEFNAYWLVYVDGYTHKEAADLLGVGTTTIENRIKTAKEIIERNKWDL